MSTDKKPERKKLITPVFRMSFPNLFVARKSSDDPDAKAKFGCSAIWTPAKFSAYEKKLWQAILAELDRESKAKFGKAWANLPDTVRRGLRDGAAKEGLEGYGEGTRFANLTSNSAPGVIDIDKTDISKEEGNTDLIYPGCYCRATVNVYSFDKNKGKGVALGLRNVQKVKNGDRLDSRVAASDDFDEDVDSAWLDGADDSMSFEGSDEIPF